MQGYNLYQPKLFLYVDIEKLIPQNHILRKIDKIFDLSFVRKLTEPITAVIMVVRQLILNYFLE